MKISVAMATFNGERFLAEQLASLTSQTRLPDELVVTDDNSSDHTVEILENFARSATFSVKILRHSANLGFRETYYRSIAESCGDWIAFCDQDDVWLPTKLSIIEDTIRRSDPSVALIAHSAVVVDEALKPSGISWPRYRRRVVLEGRRLPIWWNCPGFSLAFRRDLVPLIREMSFAKLAARGASLSEQSSHDIWTATVAQSVGKIALLPDPLVMYRRHARSTSEVARAGSTDAVGIRRSRRLVFRARHAFDADRDDVYEIRARVAKMHANIFNAFNDSTVHPQWQRRLLEAELRYRGYANWMERRYALRREGRLQYRAWRLASLALSFSYIRYCGLTAIGFPLILRELMVDLFATFGRRCRAPH